MGELREGYKQTDIGIIPANWNLIKLKKLGVIYSGGTPSTSNAEYWDNGDINWCTPTDISALMGRKCIEKSSVRITKIGLNNSSAHLLPSNSILVCTRATIGKAAINKAPMATNQGFKNIVITKDFHIDYVYYQIVFGENRLIALGSGSTFFEVSKNNFDNFFIPIPEDSFEQEAIAEVLSDLDSLIEALDQRIAKKRAIKEGAMQELLTGKKRLVGFPEPWVETKLGNISAIKTGTRNGEEYIEDGLYPFFVRSKIVQRINSYSFDGEAILIPGEGGIGEIFHYINGKFDYHQRVYKISNFRDQINCKFVYYYLKRYFGSYALQQTVKATVDSLRLPTFTEFRMDLPKTKKEQQAIARILTDIDDEIDSLEQERAKYTALKQGAMQKLLTGEIRLVNTSTKSQREAEIRTIPIDAHIVGGHIVNKLHGSKGWGRTKLQKSMHLVGYCCQLDFGNEYIRNTAGPDDQKLMNHIDSKFKTYRHVRIDELRDKEGKKHYNYTPTPKIEEVEQAFENYPEETQKAINLLLDKIWGMDLARAEIVSTLYAVWNNRIIKEQPINDDLLLKDFYDWSAHKSDFSPDLVLRGLNYMRDNEIVPVGWGRYIDKK